MLGTADERRSPSLPFSALFFPGSKKGFHLLLVCPTDFQSSDGEAQSQSHDLPETFCVSNHSTTTPLFGGSRSDTMTMR